MQRPELKMMRSLALGAVLVLTAGSATAEDIKIGVFNSLTGTYAFGGVPIQNAMKLAIREANDRGALGANKLQIIEGDTASDKGQSITLVSKFAASDNVLMILGPTTSIEATAGAPLANERRVPMFSIGSSKDILKAGPYTFKVQAHAVDIMGFLGSYAVETLKTKKIALIYGRENDGLITQKDAFKKQIVEAGVEIVSEDGILSSDMDFVALSTKLAKLNIDSIFIAPPGPEQCANLIIQMKQAGLSNKVRILGPSTLASATLLTNGGKAVEDVILVSDYFPSNPSAANQAFVNAYTRAYGLAPDNWAAMGYTLASLAVEAIKAAGPNPDREKVRAQLARLNNVPVIIGDGKFRMDAERNPSYGGVILKVKNGAFTFVQ